MQQSLLTNPSVNLSFHLHPTTALPFHAVLILTRDLRITVSSGGLDFIVKNLRVMLAGYMVRR